MKTAETPSLQRQRFQLSSRAVQALQMYLAGVDA